MVKKQRLNKAPHKSRRDTSYFASPFNIQPVDSKDQSRKDKLKYLKANGITGKNALRLAKGKRKLSSSLKQNQNTFSGKPGPPAKKPWSSRKQEIKLPQHIPSTVPWTLPGPEESCSGEDHSIRTKRKHQILPSSFYSLPQSTIAALQCELQTFTKYIRLTPHEIAARNSVVEFITKLSHSLWHKDVIVQQFGSYATLDVCTFQSDIDLALWNVVDTEDENVWKEDGTGRKEEYIFGEKSGTVLSQSSLLRTMQKIKSQSDASKKTIRQNERKEEWKKVLEEVDLANSTSAHNGNDGDQNNQNGAKFSNDDDVLFVIDRKGEKVSDGEDVPNTRTSDSEPAFDDAIDFVIDREGAKKQLDKEDDDGSDKGHDAKPAAKSNADGDLIVIDDSSDDDDDVDKMDSFHRRSHAAELGVSEFSSLRDSSVIDLCSSDDEVARGLKASYQDQLSSDSASYPSDDDDDDANDSGFDLNISSQTDFGSSDAGIKRKTIGPTGKVRTKVVKALSLLGKRLWKSSFAQNIQVRKNARVPIICATTRFGFDSDVALGGHNGVDTSQYVRKVVEKHDSFATVILFLKILLQQVNLDKPFTGGLGSYRLYVLVANHFNAHKSLGGGDSAAEMLLSFFYRYSTPSKSRDEARTQLKKEVVIRAEGGEADLSAVSVDLCIELFQRCFEKLMDGLENHEGRKDRRSLIATLVDVMKVKRERTAAVLQAKSFRPPPSKKSSNGGSGISKSGSSDNLASKKTHAKAAKKTHAKSKPESKAVKSGKKSESPNPKKGPKRSARGALVPKRRFDLETKLDGMDALMQRGGKTHRKNKKKQKRDSAITEFVMRTVS